MILSNKLLGFARFFQVGLANQYSSSHSTPANKTLLARLRKKTGYTFTNCKKALELHAYDFEKAERWLADQAQALGWSKATKLEGRPTAQGLIAIIVDKQDAAIVEVNCETDFVARNKTFEAMAEAAALACMQFAKNQTIRNIPITKMSFDSERLRHLPALDGRPLSDHLALVIGSVGENLSLRRAICIKSAAGVKLAGYTHPTELTLSSTLLGKYGALVAYQELQPSDTAGCQLKEQLGRGLCQHVVGMNPRKVGIDGVDEPAANVDDEHCLLYQEYLLDPTLTVAQLVSAAGIQVLEFERFECGEEFGDAVSVDMVVEQGG